MTNHHLTRRETLAAFALSALSACAHGMPSQMSLARLIARHTRARGGAEALDRVKRITMDVTITEKGQTYHGRYFADSAGLVRIDIYVANRLAYREGVDSDGVWGWGDGPEAQPSVAAGAANALQHGAELHLFGLHRFGERGHKLRLLPPQSLDGVEHPLVECIFATGHLSHLYFDPSTWLIARRRDTRAYHPDNDPTKVKVETRFANFTSVEGIVAPHRQEDYDLATGAMLSVNQVSRRAINPAFPPGLFDRDYVAPPNLP